MMIWKDSSKVTQHFQQIQHVKCYPSCAGWWFFPHYLQVFIYPKWCMDFSHRFLTSRQRQKTLQKQRWMHSQGIGRMGRFVVAHNVWNVCFLFDFILNPYTLYFAGSYFQILPLYTCKYIWVRIFIEATKHCRKHLRLIPRLIPYWTEGSLPFNTPSCNTPFNTLLSV